MKKIMLLSAVMGSLISVNAFAHNIQPNQLLANVTVSDKGEITLNGNDEMCIRDRNSDNDPVDSNYGDEALGKKFWKGLKNIFNKVKSEF